MTPPRISEATIREHADGETVRRGRQYYQSDAVSDLTMRGQTLQAWVEGSQEEPYRVRIAFDGRDVTEASCTCPYEWGGWCKHVVAALLAYIHQPAAVTTRPPLTDTLAGLSRDQLQALLVGLAEHDPTVADRIEAQVDLLATATSAGEAAPSGRRAPVDPGPVRRQARQVVRAASSYEYDDDDYGGAGVEEMRELLRRPRSLIEQGDGWNALRLLEPITDECADENWILSDEEGETLDFFPELIEAWVEALLVADLTPDEREEWAAKLDEWAAAVADYVDDTGFEMAKTVAEQGWEHPSLRRVLSGEAASDDPWAGDRPPYAAPLAPIWLRVLERQGRADEYLRLARAAEEWERYAVMLARLGRTTEALQTGLDRLTTAEGALALAQALRERGETAGALQVAERGLDLEEPRAPLATWLTDLAVELGRPDLALRAAEAAFRSKPSPEDYHRARELAGAGWPALRERLLDHLRRRASDWNVNAAAVEIFLSERLIDDAIAAVRSTYNDDLLEQVMDAAIGSRNEWVIRTAAGRAEPIMNEGRSGHYDEAVGWLRRARDAYRADGRTDAWRAYLAALREKHGRKYKLMGLMQSL
jgi:uncharacterized Zn finger protein